MLMHPKPEDDENVSMPKSSSPNHVEGEVPVENLIQLDTYVFSSLSLIYSLESQLNFFQLILFVKFRKIVHKENKSVDVCC